MQSKYLFLALFFLLILVSVNAQNFYVSTTGSDSNPGTEALPFRTIQKGTNTALAGDTVFVRQGTYVESLISFANSGTAGNYITLSSYPNEIATINPGQSQSAGTNCTGGQAVFIDGVNYIIVENMKIVNGHIANINIAPTQDASNIIIRNNELVSLGVLDNSGHVKTGGCGAYAYNITIENNLMYDWYQGGSNCCLAASGVHLSAGGGPFYIRNNEVYGMVKGVWWKSNGGSFETVIENNFFHDISGGNTTGFEGRWENVTIKNNVFQNMGSGILIDAQYGDNKPNNHQVIHNTFVDVANAFRVEDSSGGGNPFGPFDNVFRNNIVYNFSEGDNSTACVIFKYNTSPDDTRTVIEYDLFYSNSVPDNRTLRHRENYYDITNPPQEVLGDSSTNIIAQPIFANFTNDGIAGNDDFTLVAGSPGKNAASDGTDMGAKFCNVGINKSCSGDNTLPIITIISPTSNPTYTTSNPTISLSGTASDNIGVTQVSWSNNRGGNGIAVGTTNWSASSISLQSGSNVITVTARDAAGNTGNDIITVTYNAPNDTIPPTVSITNPANNATVTGTINITTTTSDNVGVTLVEFFIDNVLKASDTIPPFSYLWNTTQVVNGLHSIFAKAFDAASNSTQSSTISVNVNNTPADTIPPTVSITNPANNATITGTINIIATASDNVGVTKVEFYIDNVLKFTDTAFPYSYNWDTTNVTNGSHSIKAIAFDAAGNTSQSLVNITVNNQSNDTQAPTVSITNPANNATITGTINIIATASDNVGVVRVDFKIDGILLSSDTSSPYSFSLNTAQYSNGSHLISATAFDAANNFASHSINVSINNQSSGQQTITITDLEDTYLNINSINYSTQDKLRTYTWPDNTIANTIILKWNLSQIPNNAIISNAELKLYFYGFEIDGGDALYDISVHRIRGKNPEVSKATGKTFDGINDWTANGNPFPLALADIFPPRDTQSINKTFGYKTWNVTPIVTQWMTGSPNYGMLLNSDNSATADSDRYFASKQHSNTLWKPQLIVSFTLPQTNCPSGNACTTTLGCPGTCASDNLTCNDNPNDNCPIVCEDNDEDGFNNSACGGLDCNDSNPSINPNATELCNAIDDNCDGNIDETFDLDGDSFTICNGDCNDSNPNVNPSAQEVCEDGIDNDCSGEDAICTNLCGNGTIDAGETCSTCPLDVPLNSDEICCSGEITMPLCSSNDECNDLDECTIDSCVNAGACNSFCSFTIVASCSEDEGKLKEFSLVVPELIIDNELFILTVLDSKTNNPVKSATVNYNLQTKSTDSMGKVAFIAVKTADTITLEKNRYKKLVVTINVIVPNIPLAVCGNEICEESENEISCPVDCLTPGNIPVPKLKIVSIEKIIVGKSFRIKIIKGLQGISFNEGNIEDPVIGATVTYNNQTQISDAFGMVEFVAQENQHQIRATKPGFKAMTTFVVVSPISAGIQAGEILSPLNEFIDSLQELPIVSIVIGLLILAIILFIIFIEKGGKPKSKEDFWKA